MDETLSLACELVSRASVTPEDGDCQRLVAERLTSSGFRVSDLPYGEVTNLWARRGDTEPLFVFAGHTDVVPPGRWISGNRRLSNRRSEMGTCSVGGPPI